MPDPRPTRRRTTSGRRKLALLVGAAILALLAVEGAVRLRHWFKHGSLTPVYDFVVDEASGLRIPRPGAHGRIVCDTHGFRSPEPASPKPPGTVRVAFLGASTTFCAEASGNDATWPALVVEGLRRQHPERRFDWINAAAAGFTVEQSSRNLEVRVAPQDPDVIVIYHATNDLTKDTRALAVAAGLWHEDEGPGWLERHSMAWEILTKNLALLGRPEETGSAQGTLPIDAAALGAAFATRLESLVRDSQAVADLVVLVTFSHRVRPEQDAAARREACQSASYYMPFLTTDAILAGISAYNDAIRAVAARTGAVLVDGEHRIPADGEHFNDSVHLLDAGCRRQAERILAVLAKEGVLDPAWR